MVVAVVGGTEVEVGGGCRVISTVRTKFPLYKMGEGQVIAALLVHLPWFAVGIELVPAVAGIDDVPVGVFLYLFIVSCV